MRRGLKMFAGTWLRLLAWTERELRPLAASLPSSWPGPGPDTDHPQYTTHLIHLACMEMKPILYTAKSLMDLCFKA